jgi:hypothetical protein
MSREMIRDQIQPLNLKLLDNERVQRIARPNLKD